MFKELLPALRITVLMTVLTGLVYPGLVTALSQLLFRSEAEGSFLTANGQVVGSSLIGQNFSRSEYFHPRPSTPGANGYDASASSGSNLGPTSQKLVDRTRTLIAQFRADNPDFDGPIPPDAVTASSSGLDPHISPANAFAQVARVAKARGGDPAAVQELVERSIEQRTLGILGEPRVNVLLLNIAIDREFPARK